MRGLPRARSSGFTLIEIIIVIALFSALLALGLFMSMDAYRGFSFRSEQDTIVSLLQRARSRAMNNNAQAPWGVCYLAPNYAVFRGIACVASAVVDTVAANAGVAAASGFVTTFPVVVFTQLSGTTTATTITVLQDNRSSTISINNEGTIIW